MRTRVADGRRNVWPSGTPGGGGSSGPSSGPASAPASTPASRPASAPDPASTPASRPASPPASTLGPASDRGGCSFGVDSHPEPMSRHQETKKADSERGFKDISWAPGTGSTLAEERLGLPRPPCPNSRRQAGGARGLSAPPGPCFSAPRSLSSRAG
ncbi:hypothetical protein D7Y11_13280 [Corallococcus sp. AB018]|nr:hypothetical protein D7Y11_13280 [Corallococcus sp. AB018]